MLLLLLLLLLLGSISTVVDVEAHSATYASPQKFSILNSVVRVYMTQHITSRETETIFTAAAAGIVLAHSAHHITC